MSNPTDPTKPDQPHPNTPAPDGAKPEEAKTDAPHKPDGASSYEFQLPEGAGSYSDLPPVPQPDPTDTTPVYKAAVPPRPAAERVATGTFDFIELPAVPPPSGTSLPKPPEPPALTPTEPAVVLPPASDDDSVVNFAQSVPTAEPASGSVPDVGTLYASSDPPSSVSLGGQAAPGASIERKSDGSFVLPALSDPSTPDVTSLFPPPEVPAAGTPALADLELPTAEPVSADELVPPTAPTAHDSAAVLGNLEPINPVAPASGWLDSDVGLIPAADLAELAEAIPAAEPTSDPLEPAPADVVESSDIFSGSRTAPALPVEQSDVIAATAGDAPPAEPARPSEVALTFDAPPGGSTMHDDAGDELPVADEVPADEVPADDSGGPGLDEESIHDMPDPVAGNPLFDSSKLAEAPDLPDAPPRTPRPPAEPDDATDYGAAPAFTGDASSILADLHEPPPASSADSSSVRVEAPGVDRTLTGGPADGAFDLTVSDEPIPADLFGEPSDGTSVEQTDWQSHSGSDLFAEARTAPATDFPPGAETVDPADADLMSDLPSLTASPSSIFSANKPGGTGSITGESADVRIGAPAPSDLTAADAESALADANLADLADSDAAEFTDNPLFNETAERAKDAPPAVPPRVSRKPSSADFELPAAPKSAADDGGAIDWNSSALADDDHATRGVSKDASLEDLMRGLVDDSAETPTRDRPAASGDDGPSVSVDWMASSAEGTAITEAQARADKASPAKPKDRKEKEPPKTRDKKPALLEDDDETADAAPRSKPTRGKTAARTDDSGESEKGKPAKKGGGLLVGLLLGGVLAGGTAAGLYVSGAVPNSEKTVQIPPKPPTNEGNPTPHVEPGPRPPNPGAAASDPRTAFAAGGTAQALELLKAKPANTTEEKAAAGFVRVFAKVQELGKTNSPTAAANDADLKQARAELEAVVADTEAAKTAEGEKRAVAAAVRLGVSYEVAGDGIAARKVFTDAKAQFPKHAAVFDSLLERLDAAEKGPGTSFRAPLAPEDAQRVLFAVTLLLADEPAKGEDDPEPGLYYWKAVNQAAAGKYTEAVDLIGKAKAAHLKRAKALAGRGLNPLTDPLEQMFPRSCDELAAYWKLRGELYSNPAVADAIKKNGVAKTLDAFAKTEKDLATARADVTNLVKNVAKLNDDVKTAQKAHTEAENKLKTATADLKTAQTDAKEKGDLIAALAAELKPAVTLPEKWTPTDLIAGVKSAAARATGPDLRVLVPNAMVAIGGGGLSAGQLLDLADRLNKAETATKTATDKLTTETKKLTDKYAAEAAKLKTDHAADTKKLTDEHTAAVKKLKDENEAALKAEQAKTEAEKKAAALKEIGFQKQLANAVTPSMALDLWLPVLTDLRRPADAAPALAAASRALASSVPGSEDEAKAHTVTGMALLLKNDLSGARDEFKLVQRSPVYTTAKDKAWAKAADAGMDAIDDPLAPYRQPVIVPPIDLKAAARALDAGVSAFKLGKYADAATALADAAKNDPADPVAWYYLGAARWASGDTKQAEKDFAQGAEREKVSPMPARAVSAALAPIQGAVRDAVDKARP
jgi:tetratricopeptide (TPR) repeat protein